MKFNFITWNMFGGGGTIYEPTTKRNYVIRLLDPKALNVIALQEAGSEESTAFQNDEDLGRIPFLYYSREDAFAKGYQRCRIMLLVQKVEGIVVQLVLFDLFSARRGMLAAILQKDGKKIAFGCKHSDATGENVHQDLSEDMSALKKVCPTFVIGGDFNLDYRKMRVSNFPTITGIRKHSNMEFTHKESILDYFLTSFEPQQRHFIESREAAPSDHQAAVMQFEFDL